MTSQKILGFAGFLLSLAAGLGCGVSTDSTPAQGSLYTYPTEASFCTALAEAECAATVVEACYGDSSAENTNQCVSARSEARTCRTIPGYEGADMAGAQYDPASADACVQNRKQIYADAKLTRDELDSAGKACVAVFSRSLGLGAPCETDIDCDTKSALSCILKAGQSEGTCAVPEVVAPGADCSGDDQVCDEGQFCGAEGFCFAGYGEGKECAADKPCQADFLCTPDEGGSSLCVAKVGAGGDCSEDAQCEGTFCNKAAGSDMGVCTSTLTLTQIGQSCEAFLP